MLSDGQLKILQTEIPSKIDKKNERTNEEDSNKDKVPKSVSRRKSHSAVFCPQISSDHQHRPVLKTCTFFCDSVFPNSSLYFTRYVRPHAAGQRSNPVNFSREAQGNSEGDSGLLWTWIGYTSCPTRTQSRRRTTSTQPNQEPFCTITSQLSRYPSHPATGNFSAVICTVSADHPAPLPHPSSFTPGRRSPGNPAARQAELTPLLSPSSSCTQPF